MFDRNYILLPLLAILSSTGYGQSTSHYSFSLASSLGQNSELSGPLVNAVPVSLAKFNLPQSSGINLDAIKLSDRVRLEPFPGVLFLTFDEQGVGKPPKIDGRICDNVSGGCQDVTVNKEGSEESSDFSVVSGSGSVAFSIGARVCKSSLKCEVSLPSWRVSQAHKNDSFAGFIVPKIAVVAKIGPTLKILDGTSGNLWLDLAPVSFALEALGTLKSAASSGSTISLRMAKGFATINFEQDTITTVCKDGLKIYHHPFRSKGVSAVLLVDMKPNIELPLAASLDGTQAIYKDRVIIKKTGEVEEYEIHDLAMPLVSITRSSDDASVYTYRKDKASCFDSRLILAEDQKIPSLCLEDVVSADTFPIGTNVFVRRSDGLYKFDKKGLIATSIVLQKNNYEFAELGEFYSNSVSGDSCRLIHLRQSQIVDTSFVGTMLKLPCNNSISSYNSDDRFILLTFDHDTIQLSVLTK